MRDTISVTPYRAAPTAVGVAVYEDCFITFEMVLEFVNYFTSHAEGQFLRRVVTNVNKPLQEILTEIAKKELDQLPLILQVLQDRHVELPKLLNSLMALTSTVTASGNTVTIDKKTYTCPTDQTVNLSLGNKFACEVLKDFINDGSYLSQLIIGVLGLKNAVNGDACDHIARLTQSQIYDACIKNPSDLEGFNDGKRNKLTASVPRFTKLTKVLLSRMSPFRDGKYPTTPEDHDILRRAFQPNHCRTPLPVCMFEGTRSPVQHYRREFKEKQSQLATLVNDEDGSVSCMTPLFWACYVASLYVEGVTLDHDGWPVKHDIWWELDKKAEKSNGFEQRCMWWALETVNWEHTALSVKFKQIYTALFYLPIVWKPAEFVSEMIQGYNSGKLFLYLTPSFITERVNVKADLTGNKLLGAVLSDSLVEPFKQLCRNLYEALSDNGAVEESDVNFNETLELMFTVWNMNIPKGDPPDESEVIAINQPVQIGQPIKQQVSEPGLPHETKRQTKKKTRFTRTKALMATVTRGAAKMAGRKDKKA